jgi:thiamine biosynthesis lipoprotein
MPAERRFRAMGSDAHVVVVGPERLADRAQARIAELERRWSRFDERSEVSALNRHAGTPVVVSSDTVELVERALDAWRLTHGWFDPTVLGALERAGYDRSFDAIDNASTRAAASALGADAAGIEIVAGTVRLAPGTGFDPGGIGKGLAADIVVDELRADGAVGVCVNLGGDVRVEGECPTGEAWTVAIEHPDGAHDVGRVGVARGAVATSTTLRRRWRSGDEVRHHLIDPTTGRPSWTALPFVTVVAGHAWTAEVLAKALVLRGAPARFDDIDAAGAAALAVDAEGRVTCSPAMPAFLAEPLPQLLARAS